jgi:membrane protease subunit (stomatin/prohibitin family)
MYISDPQTFVVRIVAGRGYYSTRDITNYLRSIIVLKLTDLLGETMKTKSMFDLPPLMEEISAATRAKIREDFEALGIAIKGFYVEAISPTEKTAAAIDDAAAIGAIGNMQSFVQYKAAQAMTTAAEQGGAAGGLAGAGVGLGAGVGMGAAMAQTIAASMQPHTQPQQVAKEATISCPKCGTANPVGAQFCNNCGTKLGGGVTCPKCGAENLPGAKFCNNCGQGLG